MQGDAWDARRQELDAWWVTRRRPRRYQIWRARRRVPTVLLEAGHDEGKVSEAVRRRDKEPLIVLDAASGRVLLRQDRRGRQEGPWADPTMVDRLLAACEALRGLRDGTPIRRRLGLPADQARELVEALRAGVLTWRGVPHPLEGGAEDVWCELSTSGALVLRRHP